MIDSSHIPFLEPGWLAFHLEALDLRNVDACWHGDGTVSALYSDGRLPGQSTWTKNIHSRNTGNPLLLKLQ
jgi:hypothetical protein